MNREEEYRLTLIHVVKWIDGNGGFDSLKPLSAETANIIADVCHHVVNGMTLEEAIVKAKVTYSV